jgi:hypothetical protein
VHTSNLAGTVNLIRRTFKLVADEFGAAGDGAGAAVELLAGGGGAEEAFFAAGVGEGGVPGVPGVVGGGEGALVCVPRMRVACIALVKWAWERMGVRKSVSWRLVWARKAVMESWKESLVALIVLVVVGG